MSQFSSSSFLNGFLSPKSVAPPSSDQLFTGISAIDLEFDQFDPTSEINISEAVLRIALQTDGDPYVFFTEGYFSVQQATNGTRVFYGWLRSAEGNLANPIEIPLINGLSLVELADQVSNIPGIVASVIGPNGSRDAATLLKTGVFNGTNQWAYFFKEDLFDDDDDLDNDAAPNNIKPFIKYYLTSVEPNMAQSNPSQSLGGFISPTEISETSTLSREISFQDSVIQLTDSSLNAYSYIQIQDEIIEVSSWNGSTAIVARRRAFDTPARVHFQGAVVRGLNPNDVFTNGFTKDRKQYRCIAIRNESTTLTAKKAEVYFKIPNRNRKSNWRIALEVPRSEYQSTSATSGTLTSVTAAALAGRHPDDLFVTAPVVFTGGQNAGQTRIVTGYDGASGTFSFDEELPFVPQSGDAFYADTAPAQRVPNGTSAPDTSIGRRPNPQTATPYLVQDFDEAEGFSGGQSINVNGSRTSTQRQSVQLGPKEAIYVWIERSLEDDNPGQENNRIALTLEFSKV
jgi:hypothetical protein